MCTILWNIFTDERSLIIIFATVNILQEMGKPDHLTCLLRNLYAGQEACMQVKKQQLELGMEQQTGSK